MHITCLYRLIPFLFLICLSNICYPNTQQQVEVWTVSGLPAHMTLRHYVGLPEQNGSSSPQVVNLQNDALKLDETQLQRDRDRAPRLVSAILSPDSRFLMCHWIGIWRDGAYSALCVYDVHDGKLILNWISPSHEFYVDCDWLNADEIWCSTPQIEKAGVWQKQRYYAVSLATGQSRSLTAKETATTVAALRTAWKPVASAAKVFKSLGFKPRPTREMGQSSPEADIDSRHMSSHGAVSLDGKLAILTKTLIENNTRREFYQIIKGGKLLAQMDNSDIHADSIRRVCFVDDMLCISIAKSGPRIVQMWTVEQKPRLVAQLNGDSVVDQSLIRQLAYSHPQR